MNRSSSASKRAVVWVLGVMPLMTMCAPLQSVDQPYLEALQLQPTEDYFQRLQGIVLDQTLDPYLRERAVFTMTDIARRKNQGEEVIAFLEELAGEAEQQDLRSAAYANIDLLRSVMPVEQRGGLELSVSGEIRAGSEIVVVARVSSTVDLERRATIAITSLPNDIEMLSRDGVRKVALQANRPTRVSFHLRLKEPGRFFVPVTLKLSFSRTDYEKIQKRVYLTVGEEEGSFAVVE